MRLAWAGGPRRENPSPQAVGETADDNQAHKREETGRQKAKSACWSRWVTRTDARKVNSSEVCTANGTAHDHCSRRETRAKLWPPILWK